jgi:hypothetical protein
MVPAQTPTKPWELPADEYMTWCRDQFLQTLGEYAKELGEDEDFFWTKNEAARVEKPENVDDLERVPF